MLRYFLVLTVERRAWPYGVGYLRAPSFPSILPYSLVRRWGGGYGPTGSVIVVPPPSLLPRFSRVDGGVDLVLLFPLLPCCYCFILWCWQRSAGYGPTGSSTVVPTPSLLTLLFSLVWTVESRVWSYGVW